MDAARVKQIARAGFLIGRSVHTVAEGVKVSGSGAVDYLIFGTIFETASKPGVAVAGLDQLGRASAAIPVPVLAVGGITLARASGVARTGAAGVAAIALFADGPADELPGIVEQIAIGFDTP